MVRYDNLWILMKNEKLTKTQLRNAAGLSTSTFAKLTRNEIVSLDVLVRICKVFNCQISDICKIVYREGD